MDNYRRSNQALWDEWTRINAASQLYNLEGFKAGRCSLKALELEEVGDVQGKSLLHLQCHFGMDTLSWARRGARVTGADFSPEAVRLAQSLSAELSIPARFVCSDLYALPEQLTEQFDIVFTSYGALTWLSDLPRWAQIAASYVKPGGVFYIAEFHPFAMVFGDSAQATAQVPLIEYPYFNDGVVACPVQGSYADHSAVQFLHEWPFACNPIFHYLVEDAGGGLWRLPEGAKSLPLQFSIRAVKEAC